MGKKEEKMFRLRSRAILLARRRFKKYLRGVHMEIMAVLETDLFFTGDEKDLLLDVADAIKTVSMMSDRLTEMQEGILAMLTHPPKERLDDKGIRYK